MPVRMFPSSLLLAAGLLAALPVHAELQARKLDGSATANAYYDTNLDITWLANANLAASNTFGVVGHGYDDGINYDGSVNWDGANRWITAMNNAHYLGYSDWRLPRTWPVNGTTYNFDPRTDGSTDVGVNISAPGTVYEGSKGSEMANLFYNTLGNQGGYTTAGAYNPNGGLKNAGPFQNVRNAYWSGTDIVFMRSAWIFNTVTGNQTGYPERYVFFAWAVRDGDVAAVPEPGTWAMFLGGLAAMGAIARRGNTNGKAVQ